MLSALQKLKTILDSITVASLPVKFSYLEAMPTSFPAGMVLSNGFVEEMLTNTSNKVTESFVIKLIYPQTESQAGYEKWMTLLDLVSAEFRKKDNQTLTGTAINMMVDQGLPPEFSDDYSQPVVIFGISIKAETIKSIS